jgi:multidrug transporter EmrE-like cation transporter
VCKIRRRAIGLPGHQGAQRALDETENAMPHLPNDPVNDLGRRVDPAGIHRDTRIFVIGGGHSRRPHPCLQQSALDGLCFVLGAAAVYPLTRAVQGIPVGTAYTVFTGIGATGAVVLGIVLYGDPVTALRLTGITLVVTGVIALRASGG